MRTLSPAAAQAILARETAEVFLCVLKIEHADIDTIRIVNDTQPCVRSDGTYVPYPFEAVPPDDGDSGTPTATLRIDNVSREVTRRLVNLAGSPPTCEFSVVLASSPNTVEMGPFAFSILRADIDALVINVQLGYEESFLDQAVPAQTYTPSNSPGIFP